MGLAERRPTAGNLTIARGLEFGGGVYLGSVGLRSCVVHRFPPLGIDGLPWRYGPNAEQGHNRRYANKESREDRKRLIEPVPVFPRQNRKSESGWHENRKRQRVEPIPQLAPFIEGEDEILDRKSTR